jgi:excisionase family DNA binding protein
MSAANDNGFKLAYSYKEAVAATGSSRNTLSRMVASGELEVCRRGRRVFIPRYALEAVFKVTAKAS